MAQPKGSTGGPRGTAGKSRSRTPATSTSSPRTRSSSAAGAAKKVRRSQTKHGLTLKEAKALRVEPTEEHRAWADRSAKKYVASE